MEDNIKSMEREDLVTWRPKVNTEYNGYNYTNKHGHKRVGYTIIYFKNKGDDSLEEHYGGFDIIDNQVKIWYMSNNQKIQKFVPISQCKFSKSISGHVNYYHCIIDASLKGNNMSANNRNASDGDEESGKEYGLKEKDNVEEPVKFRVRPEQAGIIGRITGHQLPLFAFRPPFLSPPR